MKLIKDYFWPVVGLLAVVLSVWLLYDKLKGISFSELKDALLGIPTERYLLAIAATLLAYGALAWYDRIALIHLRRTQGISWLFVSVCSFTTYALSHNIGASVLSGAAVRYRAYTSKGLSGGEVAVLVALCSFTYGLGTILMGGLVLTFQPDLLSRLGGFLPGFLTEASTARVVGLLMLGFVALYTVGSLVGLRPLRIGKFKLEYPRPAVSLRQLAASPMELIGAAGIIYFALPAEHNPGFVVVLAVFLASFSAALASHAPGGLGVFELIFLAAMPEIPQVQVLAALLVFRLFFLLLPFAMALPVVLLFEKTQLGRRLAPPGESGLMAETQAGRER